MQRPVLEIRRSVPHPLPPSCIHLQTLSASSRFKLVILTNAPPMPARQRPFIRHIVSATIHYRAGRSLSRHDSPRTPTWALPPNLILSKPATPSTPAAGKPPFIVCRSSKTL